MLTHAPVTTILPVRNLERARDYYEKRLGLTPVGLQQDGKFLFSLGDGGTLALIPKPEATKAEHTAVSFKVDDIVSEIRSLKAQGVVFEDYDFPGFRTEGHICVLGSEKAAWFKDPEGNILCLHEDV
jgi:catechol 2,3-dioxygenase-like lactoylglutathione lyase family enzyme